jgi:hypothetical protein
MTRSTCGAKTRNGACRSFAMANGRCRMHGGASTPPGPAHHSYRHGRYSRSLDGNDLAARYERQRTDPDLLSLREDIALLCARQQQHLAELAQQPADAWGCVRTLLPAALAALRSGARSEAMRHLDELDAVVAGAMAEARGWDAFTARAEQIRKLVDTERKYCESRGLYVAADQVNAVMQQWLDAIRCAVPREYIAALHEELRRLRSEDAVQTTTTTNR